MLTAEVFDSNIIAISGSMNSCGEWFVVGIASQIAEHKASIAVRDIQLVDPVAREAKHMIECRICFIVECD